VSQTEEDPLLGKHDFVPKAVGTRDDPSLSVPDRIEYLMSCFATNSANMGDFIRSLTESAREFGHNQSGLHHSDIMSTLRLRAKELFTSYRPYQVPFPGEGDPVVEGSKTYFAAKIAQAVDRVYASDKRTHTFSGGLSTSDANLFAREGWPIYECTGDMANPHTLQEWASNRGAVRTIQLMEELVSGRFLENG
jgi:hypothetical protein